MRKVKTLFLRDPEDRRFVIPVVDDACAWVLAGEGRATRKLDGTCVLFDPALPQPHPVEPLLAGWWVRRELKPGQTPPTHFVPVETDENTGKTVGWMPADGSDFAKYLTEAVGVLTDGPRSPGTHELIGPKINRNPEKVGRHVVIAHADADILDAPRDFEGLRHWLLDHREYEGLVWHRDNGDMAKLKRKDMRR